MGVMEEYQEIQENIYDEIHFVKENHAKSNENKFPLYGTEYERALKIFITKTSLDSGKKLRQETTKKKKSNVFQPHKLRGGRCEGEGGYEVIGQERKAEDL